MKKRTTNNPKGRNKNVSEDRSKKSGFKSAGSYYKSSGKPGAKRGESKPYGEKPKRSGKTAPKRTMDGKIRLNRFLAQAGICSRREADVLIETGVIEVNKKIVTQLGIRIDPQVDVVHYGGEKIKVESYQYVLLNKPKDFTTAARNEQGRRTAIGLISKATKTELKPVGKLSKDTTGLLLFTNDGDLTKRLNSPKNGLRKIFHIELNKPLRSADLKKIQDGLLVEEKVIKVQDVSFVDKAPKNQVGMEIFSTRTNIVQRIFETLGYEIIKLDRVVYAGLTKKDLPRGHWRYLTEQEVVNLGMIK